MTKSRGINAPKRHWSAWEEEFLRRHYAAYLNDVLAVVLDATVEQVGRKGRKLGLRKLHETLSERAQQWSSDPNHGSAATRFTKGHVPPNKGLRRPGFAPGNMARCQFKPGSKPHTWVPVGSYRVRQDKTARAYLEQKLNDLPGPSAVRWFPVHRLVWERANGPIPEGKLVVFKPGRWTVVLEQITLDAIELIDRRELMARNTIHNMPEQLAEVSRLRGRLTRVINDRRKQS